MQRINRTVPNKYFISIVGKWSDEIVVQRHGWCNRDRLLSKQGTQNGCCYGQEFGNRLLRVLLSGFLIAIPSTPLFCGQGLS